MNNSIKKDFIAIVELLEANANKKVSSIMPQILELVTKRASGGSDIGKTFIKNDEGVVTHIYCYYHKQWEEVSHYGAKASTASGYNTMCKEGVSSWTKQQRVAKQARDQLLTKLSNGEVTVDDLAGLQEAIEADRNVVVPRADGHGFATVDAIV